MHLKDSKQVQVLEAFYNEYKHQCLRKVFICFVSVPLPRLQPNPLLHRCMHLFPCSHTVHTAWPKGELNLGRKRAWKCRHASCYMQALCSVNNYATDVFLLLQFELSGCSHVGLLFINEDQKRLLCDVTDTKAITMSINMPTTHSFDLICLWRSFWFFAPDSFDEINDTCQPSLFSPPNLKLYLQQVFRCGTMAMLNKHWSHLHTVPSSQSLPAMVSDSLSFSLPVSKACHCSSSAQSCWALHQTPFCTDVHSDYLMVCKHWHSGSWLSLQSVWMMSQT